MIRTRWWSPRFLARAFVLVMSSFSHMFWRYGVQIGMSRHARGCGTAVSHGVSAVDGVSGGGEQTRTQSQRWVIYPILSAFVIYCYICLPKGVKRMYTHMIQMLMFAARRVAVYHDTFLMWIVPHAHAVPSVLRASIYSLVPLCCAGSARLGRRFH